MSYFFPWISWIFISQSKLWKSKGVSYLSFGLLNQWFSLKTKYLSTKMRFTVTWVHVIYRIPHNQILNCESQSHFPIKEKVPPGLMFFNNFFYWHIALRFLVQNLTVRDLVHDMNSGYCGSYFSKKKICINSFSPQNIFRPSKLLSQNHHM